MNKDVGHVVTGNLKIIRNRKLRKLFSKGPSYREPYYINWERNLATCVKAVLEFKRKWAKKEQIDSSILSEWSNVVIDKLKSKVHKIKLKHKHKQRNYKKQVLKNKACLDYLSDFHRQFVLVPADKASNNIIIVCKKYYLDTVLKELDTKSGDQPIYYLR